MAASIVPPSSASSSVSVALLTRHLSQSSKHCFVSLPRGTFQQQLQSRADHSGCMTLAIEWTESSASSSNASSPASPSTSTSTRRIYVGWLGEYLPEDSDSGNSMAAIGIPALFASTLAIPAGIRVQVILLPDRPPPSFLVSLEPLTSDDWEILELNSGAVEMELLSQIQVLNPAQVFPLWIGASRGNGVCIKLKNATNVPKEKGAAPPFFKLTLNSELSIIPKPRPSKKGAVAPALPVPSGPAPPIAKLRVQPRDEVALNAELTIQKNRAKEWVKARKEAQIEARIREYEEKQILESSPFLDMGNVNMTSATSLSTPAPPPCTLDSPYYVHVSPASMRYLLCNNDDLVVMSFQRKVAQAPHQFPLAPPTSGQDTFETITRVMRIASASDKCIFDSRDGVGTSYLANGPHYILLPRSLQLDLRCAEFEFIHLQKLTGHNSLVSGSGSSSIVQSLCVRESLQKIQSIRLREIEVTAKHSESNGEKNHASNGVAGGAVSNNNNLNARALARESEADAKNISEAFINSIRSTAPSHPDPANLSASTLAAIAVPIANGSIVQLEVPTIVSDPMTGHRSHRIHTRYFSVHLNEIELVAKIQAERKNQMMRSPSPAASALMIPAPATASSLAAAAAAEAVKSYIDASASDPTTGGDPSNSMQAGSALKVSMATSYFLLRAPPPELVQAFLETQAKLAGKKSKKLAAQAALLPPALPVPLLNPTKQSIEVTLNSFETWWRSEEASSSSLTTTIRFENLGGSPEFHRSITVPLFNFLRSTLSPRFIQQRTAVLRTAANAEIDDGDDETSEESISTSVGGMMLVGASGSGKSELLRSMCTMLRAPNVELDVLSHTIWIDCKDHLTQRIQDFKSFFQKLLFKRITSLLPGSVILILEDLDTLAPKAEENDGSSSLRSNQLCEIMYDALSAFQAQHPSAPVALVAICQSTSSHHPLLNLLFPQVVSIANPSLQDRISLLRAMSSQAGTSIAPKLDLQALARRSEGFRVADLKQLLARTSHAAISRTIKESIQAARSLQLVPFEPAANGVGPALQLTSSDFDSAFHGFIPRALKDLSLEGGSAAASAEDQSQEGWEGIGGLFEVKRTLLDTFELPTRYANLFASAPLKLRSGLLLYGPSGVGKTLIASHIAARCGLNFLSVKGPELLNKYIGSSEANVRDIFARARNAAPALLFFDEMESIVPARGGDSTGVTDRVVNQFLCELDGVEGKISGGKQLYVLGASSRPDLIDPALLRPGRLDKSIYCGLPNEEERLDMLQRMTRKLTVHPDGIDLQWVAGHTNDYTPADLQAIVTNAQMMLVQEVISVAQEAIRNGTASTSASMPAATLPPLTQQHLLIAFEQSKPSTSASERARLDRIYAKYRLNRESTDSVEKQKSREEDIKELEQNAGKQIMA